MAGDMIESSPVRLESSRRIGRISNCVDRRFLLMRQLSCQSRKKGFATVPFNYIDIPIVCATEEGKRAERGGKREKKEKDSFSFRVSKDEPRRRAAYKRVF